MRVSKIRTFLRWSHHHWPSVDSHIGYVDDFVLLATSASDFQRLLAAVAELCDVFNMDVNCAKTRLMAFAVLKALGLGLHETLSPVHVTFRGQPLEVVQLSRYLGFMFSSSLGLGSTILHLRCHMQLSWGTLFSQYGHLCTGISIWIGMHWIALTVALRLCCIQKKWYVPAGSYACQIWAFRALGAPLPVGAPMLRIGMPEGIPINVASFCGSSGECSHACSP
jgi:hypothetical protein